MSALITIDPGNKMDMKKITGNVFVLAILGALGFAAYVYLLPFLLSVVWGTVELIAGVAIGAFLLYFITNPKTWRAFRYLGEAASQFLLGWVIEMNPFNILEFRLDSSEQDSEDLLKYSSQMKGKKAEIADKIKIADKELSNALSSKELCEARLREYPNDNTALEGLQEALSTIQSNKDYIDGMTPILNDLTRLADYTEKAYKAAKLQIKIARKDLSMKRDLFETVTTASSAISKAWKALNGDANLNSDAEKALEFLRKDIGAKIGNIQTGIKITGQFMDSKDLENASKLQTTLRQLENVDTSIPYSSTLNTAETRIEMADVGKTSKYTKFLNS